MVVPDGIPRSLVPFDSPDMRRLVHESLIPLPPRRLFDLHTIPEALSRLSPPWPKLVRVEQSGGFERGTQVLIVLGIGPLRLEWLAEYTDVIEGKKFVDRQVRGPFAAWTHSHLFLPADGGTRMRDEVEYRLPFGNLGIADALVVRPLLRGYFRERHRLLADWVRELAASLPPG
ncbi:MAG: SRPBCC family protein [Thermoanaerobaculia bacterium]